MFHYNSAPAYRSVIAMGKICELKFELLVHPPYSLDVALSDYHLFPNLEKFLGGRIFHSNEEVIDAVNSDFEDLVKSHYRDGLIKLEYQYDECISFSGNDVEK